MKFSIIIICVVILVHLLICCDANKHFYGEKSVSYGMRKIYDRTLIDDANDVPKNYTIIHKYLESKYKEVARMEFDVNVESTGYVYATTVKGKKTIEAKIQITNARNVTANIHIYAHGMIEMAPIGTWSRKDFETKSLTFVYKRNAAPSTAKPFAQNAIGKRRKNDALVYFESRNVTNGSRFPSRAFEYSGSEYITYVGFSFNSPTAMVMLNTSFIGEQEFNAVAYDMNTEHFVANMSVYGIQSLTGRPPQFEGVI